MVYEWMHTEAVFEATERVGGGEVQLRRRWNIQPIITVVNRVKTACQSCHSANQVMVAMVGTPGAVF